MDKVVAKLNDEQQKTWKELIGAPFKVEFQPRLANDRVAIGLNNRRSHQSAQPSSEEIPDRAIRGSSLSLSGANSPCRFRRLILPSFDHSTVTLLARLRGLSISQPAAARRDMPATGAGRRPGAAGRSRARREPAGRHRDKRARASVPLRFRR